MIEEMEPRWVDTAISRLLRGGVMLSIAVVLAGVALTFVHHPNYINSIGALGGLTAARQEFPNTIAAVLRQSREGKGEAVVMLGLLLLIATPVARVALSIGIFAIERDRLYAMITAAVLLLLIASFLIGAAG
jgi:uncharacterized membrane protein